MVDHIFEIPRLEVFGVKCLACDITKRFLRNNPAWNRDDIEVVIKLPCLLGHPIFLYIYYIVLCLFVC